MTIISLFGSLRGSFNKIVAEFGFELARLSTEEDIQKVLELLRPRKYTANLIRLGPKTDGGYVVPSQMTDVEVLVSPGCNGQWEFEKEFFKHFNVPALIIDSEEKKPDDFDFPHRYIDAWIGSRSFDHVRTLSSILNENILPNQKFALQMDIEGMEYESVLALDDSHFQNAEVLIIELHYLENLLNPKFVEFVFLPFIRKLNQSHQIVFLNGNTYNEAIKLGKIEWPRVIEITATIRNDKHATTDLIFNYDELADLTSDEGECFKNADMYWFKHKSH